MEEIVNISGIPYRISAENVSPQQWNQIKAEQIRKLQSIRKLSPGGIITVYQGETKTFSGTLPETGTPNYQWVLDRNGTIIDTKPFGPEITYSYVHTFTEAPGIYTWTLTVTDQCPTGAKVATDIYTVTVVTCPILSCTINIG